jgi:superfamily II DNA or RNA helicase
MSQALLQFGADDWLSAVPVHDDEDPDGLRWYQRAAYEAILAGFAEGHKSLMGVLATGLGKTELFATLAKHWDQGSILVLANRDELVMQAAARLEKTCGERVEVEQGPNESSSRARIVVGSVQSFNKRRLERMGKDRFGLVIADEVHNFLAPTYKRALDWFDCKRYGTTATPDRGDGKALAGIIDKVVYSMGIEDGIDEGYLVPLIGRSVKLEEVDLSDVKTKQVQGEQDLDQGALDDTMLRACEGIVHETIRLYPDRQGIAFFPGVKSAAYAAEKFNARRPGSAMFISGETEPLERKRLVADFKARKYMYLCNCMVAVEGFDAPTADMVIHGRPTKSRKFYAQATGRGTRVLPGIVDKLHRKVQAGERRSAVAASAKPNCVVLDFVGNAGKHTLITPEDLLGGRYNDDEIKLAKKKREKGEANIQQSLKDARKELAQKAARTSAKVKATVSSFNPFEKFGGEVDERFIMKYGDHGPAEWQVSKMMDLGLKLGEATAMNRRGADKWLDEAALRRTKGLASYRQLSVLTKWGINGAKLTGDRASQAIAFLVNNQWKCPPEKMQEFQTICYGQRQPGEE